MNQFYNQEDAPQAPETTETPETESTEDQPETDNPKSGEEIQS